MGRRVPAVHALQHALALTDDEHRTFRNDLKVRVGDDRGNFEHAVGIGAQARHLHVHPHEIRFAETLMPGG